MADQSGPDTDEFPAIPYPAPSAHPDGTVGTVGTVFTVGRSRTANRGAGIALGFLTGVLLIIIVVAGYFLIGFSRGGDEVATYTSTTTTTVEVPPADTTPAGGRPTQPDLPAGATAVNDAARGKAPAGDLNNVYTGTGTTSAEFALIVRNAFVRYYLDTGNLTGQIEATSPVTGLSYELSCSDDGSYVTCTGGNNAVIYIA